MNSQLTKLQELTAELCVVNRQLSEAARPLERSLDENEQDAVREAILQGLARWESISEQIKRTFEALESLPAVAAPAGPGRNSAGEH